MSTIEGFDEDLTPSKWYLIQHPMTYQGWTRHDKYFEGWYFKIVDPNHPLALAFIPGISKEGHGEGHSFVQVLDGIACKSYYFEYGLKEFKASPRNLSIEVGPHRFSDHGFSFRTEEIEVDVSFGPWAKLPQKIWRPGIMGWYSYMPFMECYHGLGSFYHSVSGEVKWGTKKYLLDKAVGYLEKDWGTSFPKSWIWTQCNTFEGDKELSVFASVAHIPWRNSFFIGFLAAIYYQGRVEIFATYNGSTKEVALNEREVTLAFARRKKHLRIQVIPAPGAELRSPVTGEMRGKVNESLQAQMTVNYSVKGKVLVNASGRFSGLEVAGPVEILVDNP